MQTILFTKMFRGRGIEDFSDMTVEIGFDGIDLLIRAGHQLEPGAPEKITTAVRTIEGHGLKVPMATTDQTSPGDISVERVFGHCAEAGIKLIRLGYWKYDPRQRRDPLVARARADLEGLERLAERTGVRLAIQLHGGTIHGSGAQTADLLEGRNPALIGAYPDPGNQVVQDGREDWRFTFDILEPWLCCVGVKNGGWYPGGLLTNGQRHWISDWCGLDEGMVPWDEILAHLVSSGYHGPLSFHSHYDVPLEQALDKTRADLRHIRRLIAAAA
jgi:sugar phosphate isomerase/epimerase